MISLEEQRIDKEAELKKAQLRGSAAAAKLQQELDAIDAQLAAARTLAAAKHQLLQAPDMARFAPPRK